ncbi:TniB family NTP-binding protein [Methylobacterium radiotolerans]|uniref:TniB protein n=1 Tax=Methylobacterium radiotolerans (strain ATCC 27329 / DSM 1819 / JCM 2831 / NBRC 15690 / NCIMB 10815 / 0-1) TaxID=426355 RepID=B1M7Z3_METRJ|nr:TniB family NTP-binding protein [Methylobacterium radiotolerans]ACB26714.1 hypothetical protein Mrad2831_4753 [Methylobacterium radiotolerans JCM 2831]GEN00499.1 hypothetical protein MRA01_50380 [Methylobacterium radiotolerans]
MSDMQDDPRDHFRKIFSAQDLQRIEVMQRVRGTYFRHPMHDCVVEYVDDLLALMIEQRDRDADPGSHEHRGIAVIGEPRAGKTTMLRRVFKGHPAFPGYGEKGSRCPLVTVIPQGACTLKRFTIDALRELGMPVQQIPRDEDQVAHMVRDHMCLMGVKVMHIDEAHHITQPANATQIKKIINVFKCLMIDEEWPVSLIFSGIPELIGALQKDQQLCDRFKFVRLAGLTTATDAKSIRQTIRQLAGVAELAISTEHTEALAPRLIHAGCYQLGRSIEYVQDAIEVRLKRNARLPADAASALRALIPDDFAQAYARSRGVEAADNPFIAVDWEATDPFQTLDGSEDRHVSDLPKPKRATSRKKG